MRTPNNRGVVSAGIAAEIARQRYSFQATVF
jgi:hypothetical protein